MNSRRQSVLTLRFIASVLALGPLAATGCGGDDDDDGAPASGGQPSGGEAGSAGTTGDAGSTSTGGTSGGTGGLGPIGTGGSGPIGTGGSAGVPTVTQQAHTTPIPAGSVTIENGFGVDSSGSGLQGYFWTTVDTGGTIIMPETFGAPTSEEAAEDKVCVYGTAARVVDQDYGWYWGALLGWNINQPDGVDTAAVADLSGTTGIRFTLHSETSAALRFKVRLGNTDYCVDISPGENTILWTDLLPECWAPTGDAFDPATQQVAEVGWQVPTNTGGPVDFDFCVGGIDILTGSGAGGAGGAAG